MACDLLVDRQTDYVCFYDTVTMTAFGPVMPDAKWAEVFRIWLVEHHRAEDHAAGRGDPRGMNVNRLIALWGDFQESHHACECYEIIPTSMEMCEICEMLED